MMYHGSSKNTNIKQKFRYIEKMRLHSIQYCIGKSYKNNKI